MLTLLLLPLAALPVPPQASPVSYVVETDVNPIGADSGTLQRALSARLNPGEKSPDLVFLEGGELEMRMDPSVQTPEWGTLVDAGPLNDFGILVGAGASGEDLIAAVGPQGLTCYDWDFDGTGAFSEHTIAGGDWAGAEMLEVWADGAGHEFAAANAGRTKLLRGRYENEVWTPGPSTELPAGLTDLESLDWNQDGDRETAVLITGHGLVILRPDGTTLTGWPTLGGQERICVSRSTHAGETDLLFIENLYTPTNTVHVTGLNQLGPVAFSTFAPPLSEAFEAADIDKDGRDDLILVRSELDAAEESPVLASTARIVHRISSIGLSSEAAPIVTNEDLESDFDSVSVAVASADYDNDGDQDLMFLPAGVHEQRLWYSGAVNQDDLRVDLRIDKGESGADYREATLELGVPSYAPGDHVLVEVWRLPDGLSTLEIEKVRLRRDFVPRTSAHSTSPPNAYALHYHPVRFESETTIDQPIFRIDLTMVTLSAPDTIQDSSVTVSWHYADDNSVNSQLAPLIYWPGAQPNAAGGGYAPLHSDPPPPRATSGPVNGSGSTGGGPPPQKP